MDEQINDYELKIIEYEDDIAELKEESIDLNLKLTSLKTENV